MSDLILAYAETDAAIRACHPVLIHLRPGIGDAAAFLAQIRRQQAKGYRLYGLWRGPVPVAIAGYRVFETLADGLICQVDDLVTIEAERGHGYGDRLFEALLGEAEAQSCRHLTMVAGFERALAHRFLYRKGMLGGGLHFRLALEV